MLNGIHLVDFANHRNTRMFLGQMTALVGPNGAGKTSVMKALLKISVSQSSDDDCDLSNFIRRGTKDPILTASWTTSDLSQTVGLHLTGAPLWMVHGNDPNQTSTPWIPDPKIDLSAARNQLNEQKSRRRIYFDDDLSPPEFPLQKGETRFEESFRGGKWNCRYFKTSARALHQPSYPDAEYPKLNDQGSNLAWVLSYLMTADPDRFARIMTAVRQVVPVIRRVRSRPTQLSKLEKKTITINKQERSFEEEQPVMGQALIFDMISGSGLSASDVSEGTLVTLAILTLIYCEDKVDMIMLDDVELGLHPRAQRNLIKQLRRVQETHPNLQILVSTHSPYVVDEMKPEEVWMLAPDKEGCAVVRRLSDHPDAKRALEVLSTGEFWSAEGEDWVLTEEGSPKVAETP